MSKIAPHPLLVVPQEFPKVWGREVWLLADLDATSVSGAGGGAVRSVVARGPLAGATLREADEALIYGLVPDAPRGTRYPLLIKLLEAREHLSVQVHPSPAYAAAHPGAVEKHESWIVTAARPDAELFLGLRSGTRPEDFARAAHAGEDALLELLQRVRPEVGVGYTLPSGLVHALGAGVEVFEVQTASDTTFRLADWRARYARPAREMHVREAVEAALMEAEAERAVAGFDTLASTPYYRVQRFELSSREALALSEGDALYVASGDARWPNGELLTAGDMWLMPAGDGAEVVAGVDGAILLRTSRP